MENFKSIDNKTNEYDKLNKNFNYTYKNIENKKYFNKSQSRVGAIKPDDQIWFDVLSEIAGAKGRALEDLTKYLIKRNHSSDVLSGINLGKELIYDFSDQDCENLIVLLSDGWDQGVGALISCARNI